jgi:hypothetical protein
MAALSLILNDPDSEHGVPSCSQDVQAHSGTPSQAGSSFSQQVSGWTGYQPFLPPTSLIGQSNFGTNLLMYPVPSISGQSPCNSGSWVPRRTSCVESGSTELNFMTGRSYQGSCRVPSLLDSFASSSACEELTRPVVGRGAEFRYDCSTATLQVSQCSIPAFFQLTCLSKQTPEPFNKAATFKGSFRTTTSLPFPSHADEPRAQPVATETRRRTTRSSSRNPVIRPHPCSLANLIKRPACNSCRVKKIRCSSDLRFEILDKQSCV